jgi:hypothetical protein
LGLAQSARERGVGGVGCPVSAWDGGACARDGGAVKGDTVGLVGGGGIEGVLAQVLEGGVGVEGALAVLVVAVGDGVGVGVLGTNGLLLIKVEHQGFMDYTWLDITEVNVAYWQCQTETATFERRMHLGGHIQTCLPNDMTDRNASQWEAEAVEGTAQVFDDTAR